MNIGKSKGKTNSKQKMESAPPSKPRLCCLERGPDGFGFNLHGEKGHHGQYIRAVDKDSPATRAGLKSGDRVIEVDGINIERETHTQVVARIKAGGGKTRMLVVDRELDAYCRTHGITIKESMIEGGSADSPRLNGDHHGEIESEGHMNGDVVLKNNVENGEVIVASIETAEESAPQRREEEEEEHAYAEVERREEKEEEEEERRDEEGEIEDAFASVTAEAETGEDERSEEEEEEVVIQAEEVAVVESVPDMAPPYESDEEPDVRIPEPEPEPVLEAATVPVVESAPPPPSEETDGPALTNTEPEVEDVPFLKIGKYAPSQPELEDEPIPEPPSEPAPPPPEPEREPEPEPEPVRAPAPVPVVAAHKAMTRTESAPPSRPAAAPTQPTSRQKSLDSKAALDLSNMDKAKFLAGGRRKKKQASAKNWEDKYAAFNNL